MGTEREREAPSLGSTCALGGGGGGGGVGGGDGGVGVSDDGDDDDDDDDDDADELLSLSSSLLFSLEGMGDLVRGQKRTPVAPWGKNKPGSK